MAKDCPNKVAIIKNKNQPKNKSYNIIICVEKPKGSSKIHKTNIPIMSVKAF